MPTALLSVTDKTGIIDFARGLRAVGFSLLSTGGTAKTLREAGVELTDVSEFTGSPEMLDGRVKTLHPKVHGGILADLRMESHRTQLQQHGFEPISLVCVNLYQFEKTVSGPHDLEQAIESIDIGGPAMIRSAAKNWTNTAVVVDPSDYGLILERLECMDDALRLSLSAKAFRHTAFYDSMISRYMTKAAGESPFSDTLTLGFRRTLALRYGENPHQGGALYVDPLAGPSGIANARQIWGLELGYNNINDANGAWELVCDLPQPACAITKHGNPCGAAISESYAESFRLARDADPISAFGGVVAVNGVLDLAAAEAMAEKGNKLDVIIAEQISPEALEVFKNRKGWGQDVRLLEAPRPGSGHELTVKSVGGGVLVQDKDVDPWPDWKVVTRTAPSNKQMDALRLMWRVVKHVKSNAIVVGTSDRLLGVGAGQMNRVQSVRLALEQAGESSKGAALASDAFFPFPDSIETAAAAGIAAIAQPGGSKKDQDVIDAADAHGIAMVFTGTRHFLH